MTVASENPHRVVKQKVTELFLRLYPWSQDFDGYKHEYGKQRKSTSPNCLINIWLYHSQQYGSETSGKVCWFAQNGTESARKNDLMQHLTNCRAPVFVDVIVCWGGAEYQCFQDSYDNYWKWGFRAQPNEEWFF
jgi:hypothetical protein